VHHRRDLAPAIAEDGDAELAEARRKGGLRGVGMFRVTKGHAVSLSKRRAADDAPSPAERAVGICLAS
jgi:hypothetical protein